MENNCYFTNITNAILASFPENSLSTNESSSDTSNQWSGSHLEQRNDHRKKKRRSESRWNRETSKPEDKDNRQFPDTREHVRFDKSQDRFLKVQHYTRPLSQQSTTSSSNCYNASNCNPPNNSFVENNGSVNSAMASSKPFLTPMYPQWGSCKMNVLTMPQNNISVNPNSAISMPSSISMAQNTTSAGMNPYYMGISGESNMYGVGAIGNNQYNMMNLPENIVVSPAKEIVHLASCVLYPPHPNAVPPPRDKPLGCKTVFVGGLPEKMTEEIIKEIFGKCGEIETIRLNKKNFCHIRFLEESCVETALSFSGYRIKIENSDEAPFTGRLNVHFSRARDDEEDYQRELRRKNRELRHKRRAEESSRPSIVVYNESECALVSEKLRNEDTFQQALSILLAWLDRGECNKKTCGSFFSMIQSTNSHIRRIMSEKFKSQVEIHKAKLELKQQMQDIQTQFNEIHKIFTAACMQKVWDHFTKPQRKNLENWKKQFEEIRNAHIKEIINERNEDEMDMSDDEMNGNTSCVKSEDSPLEQQKIQFEKTLSELQEENDALRRQLEAAENEKMMLQTELTRKEETEQNLMYMNRLSKQVTDWKHGKEKPELEDIFACKDRPVYVDFDHRDFKNFSSDK